MIVNYVPALIYLLVTVVIICVISFLSSKIGPKKWTREKAIPYECGMDPAGAMEGHFAVRFYVLSMLFIIFEIETVFLYPWAVVFRELGWLGFTEMMTFAAVLILGLVYLLKKGSLEWE